LNLAIPQKINISKTADKTAVFIYKYINSTIMPYKLSPAALQEKWLAYCRHCDEHTVTQRYRDTLVKVPKPVIYSVEGFCNFATIGEDELERYSNNKNYKGLVKDVRFWVLCRKVDALVNGEGSTTGLVFDLKVNYGFNPLKPRTDEDWNITLNLGDESIGPPPSAEERREIAALKQRTLEEYRLKEAARMPEPAPVPQPVVEQKAKYSVW